MVAVFIRVSWTHLRHLIIFKAFTILIECDVIRLILDAYTKQQSRVLWNICVSEYVTVSNGVKQGDVLAPILFYIIYIM